MGKIVFIRATFISNLSMIVKLVNVSDISLLKVHVLGNQKTGINKEGGVGVQNRNGTQLGFGLDQSKLHIRDQLEVFFHKSDTISSRLLIFSLTRGHGPIFTMEPAITESEKGFSTDMKEGVLLITNTLLILSYT